MTLWQDSLTDWFEDPRHPLDEPHARAIAVVKILITLVMFAAVIAAGLIAASGYWSSIGH